MGSSADYRVGLLGTALCLAVAAQTACAAMLTVDLTLRVSQIYDPGNVLGGQLSVGQAATGRYSYETIVVDQDPDPQWGVYFQTASQGSASVSVGPYTFESDPSSPTWRYRVWVRGAWDPSYQDFFRINSFANKALSNGASVFSLDIDFSDMSGAALNLDTLPTTAPNIAMFPERSVLVQGMMAEHYYWASLRIESARSLGGTE